jgi:uncharacterized protein (DUF58 family)
MELVAKTVVDGFVAGLHRSPDFGFSQEFAEYRAYTPGDDLRHVDWNVFARTERAYLKRYRGETNTAVHVLLDVSASMGFASGAVKKIDYAKFLASAIVYLAHLQRDSASLIVFHEELANFVPASSRSGQLMRLLHAVDQAAVAKKTNYERLLFELQQFLKRRGITVLISDFFDRPEAIIRTVEPLRFRGNEVILFHVLDPGEIEPALGDAPLLVDMETGEALETTRDYAHSEYKPRMAAHIAELRERAEAAGLDYFLLRTDRPLDAALREYFSVREGRM